MFAEYGAILAIVSPGGEAVPVFVGDARQQAGVIVAIGDFLAGRIGDGGKGGWRRCGSTIRCQFTPAGIGPCLRRGCRLRWPLVPALLRWALNHHPNRRIPQRPQWSRRKNYPDPFLRLPPKIGNSPILEWRHCQRISPGRLGALRPVRPCWP